MDSNELLKEKILDCAIRGTLVENDEKISPLNEIRENVGLFDIPKNWIWCRYENIGNSGIGLTYRPDNINDDGMIVLRSSNIQDGKLDLKDIVRVECKVNDNIIVKENDILICARNGSKRLVGKSCLLNNITETMTYGAFMTIFRTSYYKYVYWFMQSKCYYNQLSENTNTMTINQVTQKKLNSLLIPLPPLEEQHRIVNKIESLFELIDQKEKNDQENQMLKEILYFKILDKYLGESTNMIKLAKVVEKSSNINWKNETIDYKYVDLTSVDRSTDKITNITIINKNNAPSRAKQIIKKGDVIFGTTRPLLKRLCCVTEEYDNQVCSTGYCVIRPKADILDTKYLFYCLKHKSFYEYIEPLQRGVSYPAVSDKDVFGYSINVPSLEEQHRIVEKIEQCFELIEQL